MSIDLPRYIYHLVDANKSNSTRLEMDAPAISNSNASNEIGSMRPAKKKRLSSILKMPINPIPEREALKVW